MQTDSLRAQGGDVGDDADSLKTRQMDVGPVGSFLTGIGAVLDGIKAMQLRLDRVAAPAFSVFWYFKENENIVSSIFADLLRPNGSHGQGAEFLRLFLAEVDRDRPKNAKYRASREYGVLDQCIVETEHTIPGKRRIDIVVRLNDSWIGIENKPWANEQPNQLKDYFTYLRQRDSKTCVLYLSGDGRDARTMSARAQPHYRTIAYREIGRGPSVEHWISECMARCEAEKVRWFLRDMLEYIRTMFVSTRMEE